MILPGSVPTGDHMRERAGPPGFQPEMPIASSGSPEFTATHGKPASLPKSLSHIRLREATQRDTVPTYEAPVGH